MDLTPRTRLSEILNAWPFMKEFLVSYNPRFKLLESRAMRATMGRLATLQMVSSMGGVALEKLLRDIQTAIEEETGERLTVRLDVSDESARQLDTLKAMIRRLHAGEELEKLKAEYGEVLETIDPMGIAEMEQQLIGEGMPPAEIQRLCDVHVSLFQDALDAGERPSTPPGHPVHTYMAENEAIRALVESWDELLGALPDEAGEEGVPAEPAERCQDLMGQLRQVETHYARKENQLFPYLERDGFTGPSEVMWGVHDNVRGLLRELPRRWDAGDLQGLKKVGVELSASLLQMIYMEERILFPTALSMLEERDWREIRRGDDEIGYVFVTPAGDWPGDPGEESASGHAASGSSADGLQLSTGTLSLEQLDLILRHMPVECSFVDEHDRVRYYTDVPHRIFPRSPAIIGRLVQNCHPASSVHVVEKILAAFRSGEKDMARFWIQMGGRFVVIQYHAVRDAGGAYRGCLEVTQDITDLRQLDGERRLLEWEA